MTSNQNKHKRSNPLRMRAVKGCFVWGQAHLAAQRYSRDEVNAAIERSKSKDPTTLLTVENYLKYTA